MKDWSKEQLEAERIRRELRTPWVWRNIQTIVTCIVGILGLVYAAKTDLFEVQRQQLQLDVELFTAKRDSLHDANEVLLATNKDLVADRNKLLAEQAHQDSLNRESALAAKKAEAALLPAKERAAFMARAVSDANKRLDSVSTKAGVMQVDLMTQKYGYDRMIADQQQRIAMLEFGERNAKEYLDKILALKLPSDKDRAWRSWSNVGDLVQSYERNGWKADDMQGIRATPKY